MGNEDSADSPPGITPAPTPSPGDALADRFWVSNVGFELVETGRHIRAAGESLARAGGPANAGSGPKRAMELLIAAGLLRDFVVSAARVATELEAIAAEEQRRP